MWRAEGQVCVVYILPHGLGREDHSVFPCSTSWYSLLHRVWQTDKWYGHGPRRAWQSGVFTWQQGRSASLKLINLLHQQRHQQGWGASTCAVRERDTMPTAAPKLVLATGNMVHSNNLEGFLRASLTRIVEKLSRMDLRAAKCGM